MKATAPTPAEIVRARKDAGLTQTEAAALVHASLGAWQKWESDGQNSRKMHPAIWELFQIKIRQRQDEGER